MLLAWEMGEGLAHAARLLLIAQHLRADGWMPIVAARNPGALAERYAAACIPVIAAPRNRSCFEGPGRFRAASYADVMGVCGYAIPERLAAVVAAWDKVFKEQAPDAIIADYSPLLSLAAFDRIPLICVGDGFVTPHELPGGGFPALGGQASPIWAPSDLLATAQQVQEARGHRAPSSLGQIIAGNGQVVSVPRELDIYGATRATSANGPWLRPAPPLEAPPRPQVFAYLRMTQPLARKVLQVLLDARLPSECFLHEASGETLAALARAGIRVHSTPPPLREALTRASVLIHHGGIGSMEEAALAGRPQLLLPRHLEQSLNTQRALSCFPGAFTLRAQVSIQRLRQQLPSALMDARLLEAAQQSAAVLTKRPETALDELRRQLARLF